ncbi:hypothetical protein Acr_00g0100990 [Actinidia rufa]|uniref:DUF4218 domain-containing protein n=1 Tax=Actinidia rufa TaxID=165716 RepID=A0A7J0DZX4_9ERIC|nr:hypothetical protein Acr_00g0100990 [Actinidia rufa]
MQSYTIWHEHGEPRVSDNIPHSEMRDKQYHDIGGIDALVEDRIRAESTNVTQGEEMRNFQKLLKDSQRELYPGSKEYTLLKFVIEAFNMKNAMLDRCPRCNVSRYKINCGKGKKIPHKILRYFPLTPRLKRLFMSRMISEAMRWHMENPSDGEESRHPAHSDEWKDFDIKHPEFALEPRNVRLGLAVDGFNPFGNMSNSYSMWPVILVPYNLPPWLAMKDSFFMLTLLVPGDKQPGIDIDVYMRPMMDEFKELWQTGALTYDAFGRESKTAYINHRCYLPKNHPERRKKAAYNGKQEKRKRSLELPVEKIQEQLNNINEVILGKYPTNKKRSHHEPNWTKRSILYELPYFKDKKFRHNIDVMHGEKNFCENLVGTMLGIDGKKKDTDKARKELEDKGIRKELWSVHSTNGRLIGLKSHDYHILIQQILPIGMRGFVNKEISTTLFELGNFFQDLCSKTLRRSELEKLEERIVHILCKLEKIFPPAFFDVMVHLAIHLPREALLGGPVQYRWMYPFERFLGALKKFVSNRARPEGSIAEAYIVKEWDHERKMHNFYGHLINVWEFEYMCQNKVTQNSGVLAVGDYEGKMHNFYGHLINVWEFEYMCQNKVILFQCEWYNTGNTGRNCTIRTDKYCTSINVKSRWYQSDSFILPSHAKQVFYLNDTKWGEPWQVVQLVQQRGVFDVAKVKDGEPSNHEDNSEAFQQESITSALPIDIKDNIRYHREDVEVEVIERVVALDVDSRPQDDEDDHDDSDTSDSFEQGVRTKIENLMIGKK